MKASVRLGWAVAAFACLAMAGCGGVKGHTYADGGNLVSIEFQSGGKALAVMGPMTVSCTYTETSKQVTLVCDGNTTVLNIGDDGSLDGPPDGMLSHMTKVK